MATIRLRFRQLLNLQMFQRRCASARKMRLRRSGLWPALAIVAAVAGQHRLQAEQQTAALFLYAVGAILLFWYVRGAAGYTSNGASSLSADKVSPDGDGYGAGDSDGAPNLLQGPSTWASRSQYGLLFGALLLAGFSWIAFDFSEPSHAAWYAYCGALSLLLVAWLIEGVRRVAHRGWRQAFASHGVSDRISDGAVWLGALIIGVAAVVRLYNLDSLPFGTWYDEAANSLEALRIANEPAFRPVYSDGVATSGHYLYLIVLFFELFGVETESIRLISALIGIGTVAVAFGVGRLLFGPAGGVIFAALIAVSRWAVNFSRVGMHNMSTPLFALAAFYFLIRGLRSGRPSDFIAGGLAVGFGAIFYPAYFLVLPVLAIVVAAALVRGSLPWRRVLGGVGIALVVAGIVLAPTIKFALERPDNYFKRMQATSLLERTSPEDRPAALARNTIQHLRMFHIQGDPNGRHNLPGRPMLDPVSGALMILGLVVCAARPRDPLSWLLPVWVAAALLGGILSLDFESPQSLRSIGALPPAYLLATLPLLVFYRSFEGILPGRETPDVKFGPAMLNWGRSRGHAQVAGFIGVTMVLVAVAYLDLRAYFVEQAQDFASWNAFSTPETLAANLLTNTSGVAEGQVEPFIISLYAGHPTLRFLAPEVSKYSRLETTDTLPILMPPDRDVLLIVDADRRYFYEEARAIYPDAQFHVIQPPFGGPTVLYAVHLTPQDQQSILGARLSYSMADSDVNTAADGSGYSVMPQPGVFRVEVPGDLLRDAAGDVVAETDPDASVLQAEWEATLFTPSYGPHWFHVEGPGRAEVYVGTQLVATTDEATEQTTVQNEASERLVGTNGPRQVDAPSGVVLAQGPHALRIRAEISKAQRKSLHNDPDKMSGDGERAASFTVYWRTPEREWEPLPDWLVFRDPVRGQGLVGRYFANGEWSPPEAFARIDTRWEMYFHVLPLPRPYTVEWSGLLSISEAGEYGLGVQSRDESELWVNGEEIARSDGHEDLSIGYLTLEEGRHVIRIRYADRTSHTNFRLWWQPPGADRRRIIPASNLVPSEEAYARLDQTAFDLGRASDMGMNEQMPTTGYAQAPMCSDLRCALLTLRRVSGQVEIEPVVEGLEQPISVAVGVDGTLWVTEPGAGRVSGYGPDGALRTRLEAGREGQFQEPYGVAVGADGALLVLDTETGTLHRFSPDGGEALAALPIARDLGARSRGLSVDAAGNIWIAATSRGEVVKLGPNGSTLLTIPHRAGGSAWQAGQPVGVTVAADDSVWVTDPGLGKLVRYAPAGTRLPAWDIPPANTYVGPQLTTVWDGLILRSSPEEGELIGYHPAHEFAIVWQLRTPESPAVRPVGMAQGESGIMWVVDGEGGRLLRVVLHLPSEADAEQDDANP